MAGMTGVVHASRRAGGMSDAWIQAMKAMFMLRMRIRLCAKACQSSTARALTMPQTLKRCNLRRRSWALAHSTVAPRWMSNALAKSLDMNARH